MAKQTLTNSLQSKRDFYAREVSKVEKTYAQQDEIATELLKEQGNLNKTKELLSKLFGLVGKRSQKAEKIYELVNTGKDAIPFFDEVNSINGDIKQVQKELKSIQNLSKSISVSLVEVLGDSIKLSEIEKVTEKIDKELGKITESLLNVLRIRETSKSLKMRYFGYISYIDKSLNGSKYVDSINVENIIESDLVYKYAKNNGLDDVLEKMKSRELSYGEYEKFLVKINPIYAYVVHMLDVSTSEGMREICYDLLGKIESGKLSKEEDKSLEEKANQWLLYSGGEAEFLFNSPKKGSEKFESTLAYKIPDTKGLRTTEMIEFMIKFVNDLEEKDINETLVSELGRKGRGDIVKRNEKFANFRKGRERDNVISDTFGVFESADDYKNFKTSNNHGNEEALHLLTQGKVDFVIYHLKYFKGLSDIVLGKLLDGNEKSGWQKIVENYRSFGIGLDMFALEVLDRGFDPKLLFVVIGNEKFGPEVAVKFISLGNGDENLTETFKELIKKKRFIGLNSSVAILIMNQWGAEGVKYVATHLSYFESLNLEIWDKLEKSDYYWLCQKYRKSFDFNGKEASDMQSAVKSIDEGFGWKVINNIDKYVGLDYKVIINKLLERGLGWLLAKKIDKVSMQLHMYVASKLVDGGQGWNLCKNIIKFKGLSDENTQTLAFNLIEKKQGGALAARLKGFKGLNHKIIADKLIDCGQGKYVAKYWNNFEGLDGNVGYKLGKIIKEISRISGREIVSYFDLIPINDEETVINLVDSCPGAVVLYLHKFDRKYYKLIADELISIGEARKIQQRFAKFEGLLDAEIANKLIKSGFSEFVEVHANEFKGYINVGKPSDSDNLIKKNLKEENIRNFLVNLSDSEKESLTSMHMYRKAFESLNTKFKNQYDGELPKSWGSLILSLGGEKGCQRHDYLFALIKSRKDGARYLKKLKFPKGVDGSEKDVDGWMELDDYKRYVGLNNIKDLVLKIVYMDFWNNVSFDERKNGLSEIESWLNACDTENFDGEETKVICGSDLRMKMIEYIKGHFNTPEKRISFFKKLCEEINNIAKRTEIVDDESLNQLETEDVNNLEISEMDVLKNNLRSVFPESFVCSLEICEDGSIDNEDLKASFNKEKGNFDEDWSFDLVCGFIEDAGVEIKGKDLENWDIMEEYNKNNLGRIQRFLSVRDDFWELFKSIIGENGEIKKQDLSGWIERTNFIVSDDFEIKLSHFGIKILDEGEGIDFEFESGKEFVEKLELLGFECMNKDILIENIDKAGEIVVGLKSSLRTTLGKLNCYKNSGYIQGETPFSKITPTNGNPKFSVIKYKRGSGKVPRFVFSNDEKIVMNMVPHEVYDRLRDGRKEKIELNGIENGLFW